MRPGVKRDVPNLMAVCGEHQRVARRGCLSGMYSAACIHVFVGDCGLGLYSGIRIEAGVIEFMLFVETVELPVWLYSAYPRFFSSIKDINGKQEP